MTFKHIYFLAVVIILTSCSNHKTETDQPPVTVELTPLQKTLEKFKVNNNFPIIADTSLFNSLNALMNPVKGYDSLGTNEVKTLAANWFTNGEEGGSDYEFREFYKIDSIKASGTWTKWCEKLDIGQTKYSNAYALFKTVLDPNTTLAFWAFTNSSYEACPYFSGQTMQMSIIYKGVLSQTYFLGQSSGFGDPPVSSEIEAKGKLNADGTFMIDWHQVNDEDMDQPDIFVTDIHYEFVIKDGKISQTKADKKENVKTPRPKEKES
jgi:hypothetical protein